MTLKTKASHLAMLVEHLIFFVIQFFYSFLCPFHFLSQLGAIAWSVAMSLVNQEAPRSILASGTSFHEDLVMELFLRPFFLFR